MRTRNSLLKFVLLQTTHYKISIGKMFHIPKEMQKSIFGLFILTGLLAIQETSTKHTNLLLSK